MARFEYNVNAPLSLKLGPKDRAVCLLCNMLTMYSYYVKLLLRIFAMEKDMDFPKVDLSKLGIYKNIPEQDLAILQSQKDIEFECCEPGKPLFWFLPQDSNLRKQYYDILFLEYRVYDGQFMYYVAVNKYRSNMGKVFVHLQEALEFGRSITSDKNMMELLDSLRPSVSEVAGNLQNL